MAPLATHPLVILPEVLNLLPLIGREFGSEREEEASVSLFQFRARLCDLVDLAHDCGLVGLIGFDERLHGNFSFFDICAQVDELFAVLLEDVVHGFPLIVGELELFDDLWIVPPATKLIV